jgi:asparagine synthase (glutamine-hydrolysing)
VLDLLRTAVDRRLVADVPLGAFLSGGVDSSTVVALMSELTAQPVRTFTIGFEDDQGFDERPYAKLVAERFNTEHVEFVVRPDAIELIEKLVWHHDQPFGDSSAVPTYLLSELTRAHVTVALCGDGGDELFAGYERFAAALAAQRYSTLPATHRSGVSSLVGRLPTRGLGGGIGSAQRFVARAGLGLPDAFLSWLSYVPEEQRHALLNGASNWALADYRRIYSDTDGADDLARLLDINLRTYLLDDLLPKVDRMSMAHALEVRSPFLDRELLEFSLRLPRDHRIRRLSLKQVLKAAVADLLPREVLRRRKRGFGVPLDRWFRTDLKAYAQAMLSTAETRVRSYLKPDPLDEMLLDHWSGAADNGHALWALLTLEVFLRKEGW